MNSKILLITLLIVLWPSKLFADGETSLAGIWDAGRNFGPEIRGVIDIVKRGEKWSAEIAGHHTQVLQAGDELSFTLGRLGRFRGSIHDGQIKGHWIQPRLKRVGLESASPVLLLNSGDLHWRGIIRPRNDRFRFHLVLTPSEDGSLSAFLRNPERNQGRFINLSRLSQDGNELSFHGRFRGRGDERVLLQGTYRPETDVITVQMPFWGGSYDFRRPAENESSSFFPRGRYPEPWHYQIPVSGGEGWPVGNINAVGLAEAPLREMVESVLASRADNVSALYPHGILIARHGKLVFEEYFHGFHRHEPHDSRSASKSLTSVFVGAAIHQGLPIEIGMPVFETISVPSGDDELEPRKRAMTLEHLLTMSSGFYCDDKDENAPGSEEVMQSQKESNWYQYTLDVPMAFDPGEKAIYCSANSNLIGAVLSHGANQRLEQMFHSLVAEPLQIDEYHLMLQPSGEPYMGGGIHWLPRDFMKLGQLALNGGTWNGRRIISESWASAMVAHQVDIGDRQYGYQWWRAEYPFKDGFVSAFFAGGNGGQVVMGIPELDLVIAFFAGNYADPVLYTYQREWVPKYILKSVELGQGAGR